MEGQAVYYGIDLAGGTVEHGPVDVEQAIKAIRERFAALKEKYDCAKCLQNRNYY